MSASIIPHSLKSSSKNDIFLRINGDIIFCDCICPKAAVSLNMSRFDFKEVNSNFWKDFEKLFGENGACGGCWCQWLRVPKGGKLWEETKGAKARQMTKNLFRSNEISGLLAYDGARPVGWCSYGPRSVFPHLDRMKAYLRDDDLDHDRLWCINCFFIDRRYRKQGLSQLMLRAALGFMKDKGIELVEAYPTVLTKEGKRLPAAFSFTGPMKIFEREGFELVQRLSHSRPLMEKKL